MFSFNEAGEKSYFHQFYCDRLYNLCFRSEVKVMLFSFKNTHILVVAFRNLCKNLLAKPFLNLTCYLSFTDKLKLPFIANVQKEIHNLSYLKSLFSPLLRSLNVQIFRHLFFFCTMFSSSVSK